MPSSKGYTRDYQREEATAKARGEQGTGHDSGSAERHRARRKLLKLGMVRKGDDVDHKVPIVKGGSNATTNLRDRSVHANRSYPRTKDAGMK